MSGLTSCDVDCPERPHCDIAHEATRCALYRMRARQRDECRHRQEGLEARTCEECGREFWAKAVQRGKHRVTCSDACRARRQRRQKKESKKRMKEKE